MKAYRDFIAETLAEASIIARRNFGKVSGTTKPEDNNQVLTEADIEIGSMIVEAISQEYRSITLLTKRRGWSIMRQRIRGW